MRPLFPAILCAAAVAMIAAGLRAPSFAAPEPLAQDRGASGVWQRLLKLQTTASVMHTTAHPDDEQGPVLAQLSRGRGVRVSLLTLTRGESGDNAIGTELFDAVGLLRTEELLAADRYYGVDRQYFTSAVDYGFSKRLEEALQKWGRENVLREIVRIIRIDRPFVVIARFQGNERDGHGNHQAAGLLTQEACRVSGDPGVFPEQIRDGLRPWQPLKVYMGGVRENEQWSVRTDSSEYSPWLGDSYQAFARAGLSFQRSQNGGRVSQTGPSIAFFARLAIAPADRSVPASKETSFFDGIDTTIPGIFAALGRPAPAGAQPRLEEIAAEVRNAVAAFSMANPSATVPALVRGLTATRRAITDLAADPDAVFILHVKERQFEAAIEGALGLDLQAIAAVPGPVVRGQRFTVDVALGNRGAMDVDVGSIELVTAEPWNIARSSGDARGRVAPNSVTHTAFVATVPDAAPFTRPYFERTSLNESRYILRDATQAFRPVAEPPLVVRARYTVAGAALETTSVVQRREAHLPYGDVLRDLAIVPALSVNVTPRQAIVATSAARTPIAIRADLLNNDVRGAAGTVQLQLPNGWESTPHRVDFTFTRPGERATFSFSIAPSSASARSYQIRVIAASNGKEYTEGYDAIEHRDLETRHLYHPSTVGVRGVDVAIAPELKVGYVMGIGDEVPTGIAQLGAAVTLLGEQDLAAGDLRRFDAIVTGTRAYAVREDLKTYNRRLLEYVREGGNLIVLYNTQELVPNEYAPFPGELTVRAEEVSEEDSPVEILAPAQPVLNTPNKITAADFDGWVEQRGSKFWSSWDSAYTAIIATHDTGQPWQRGGWLTAMYGKGHYTYFAYALHRQLPYAVPGAYRLLANLLSLGK